MSGDPPSTCICGSDDDYGFMICCDGCDAWMHGPCVKVTKRFATGIDDYYCPRCIAKPRPSVNNGSLSLFVNQKDSLSLTSSDSPSSTSAAVTAATFRNQQSPLLKLSDELLLWILSFVRCHKSLARVSSVCRQLWRVTQDPYLWKHVTVEHTSSLRAHWEITLYPKLMASNLYELNLLGEVPSRVMIDRLRLVDFSGLRILRLEDCRVFTVYRLASTLKQLTVLVAKGIKTTNDYWDWRPFYGLMNLEELVLWRRQDQQQPRVFSLDTQRDLLDDGGELASHGILGGGIEDIYPTIEGAGAWGGYVTHSFALSDPMHNEDDDDDNDDSDGMSHNGVEGALSLMGEMDSAGETASSTGTSTPSEMSPTIANLTAHVSSTRPFLPRLRRLALVNIPSPTMHRGTDKPVRRLIVRSTTYLYWHDHNLLFPVLKTDFSNLRHLILVESCESAWSEGTLRDHATAFSKMQRLESLTLIHPAIRRAYLVPIMEALLQLPSLKRLFLAATEDTDCIEFIVDYLLHQPPNTAVSSRSSSSSSSSSSSTASSPPFSPPSPPTTFPPPNALPSAGMPPFTRWQGRVDIAIQDDLGANPQRRDWRQKVMDNVYPGLDLRIEFFRSEWEDEDAGIKRLCLQAWERTRLL